MTQLVWWLDPLGITLWYNYNLITQRLGRESSALLWYYTCNIHSWNKSLKNLFIYYCQAWLFLRVRYGEKMQKLICHKIQCGDTNVSHHYTNWYWRKRLAFLCHLKCVIIHKHTEYRMANGEVKLLYKWVHTEVNDNWTGCLLFFQGLVWRCHLIRNHCDIYIISLPCIHLGDAKTPY